MKGLHVIGLTHAFGDHRVLDNVSMIIPAGELVCLLGPSGCGKTTLLRLGAGLDPGQAATTAVADEVVADGGGGHAIGRRARARPASGAGLASSAFNVSTPAGGSRCLGVEDCRAELHQPRPVGPQKRAVDPKIGINLR